MPSEAYRRQSCPILTATDCERDAPLAYWRDKTYDTHPHLGTVTWALAEAVKEFDPGQGVITIGVGNGAKPATPEDFARVWNRAMARLGFTEGNPEA